MTLPTGTVTFLFTDIEGSTKLARQSPDQWEFLRERHHAILQSAMDAHNGYVFQVIGDAFCVAFHTASDAVRAAVKSQIDLHAKNWGNVPIKVRMGIHTGQAQLQPVGDYHGYLAMSRVQRLMSAGHGGQVLISATTQELLLEDLPQDVSLLDLGERRLKDLIRPEHIYQLVVPGLPADFPPLKTLDFYRHNLPFQLTSFIGREKEMDEIRKAIREHRLVTLTGVGGTGKTRLSLQVAADMLDQFQQGVWFVELASLTNPDLIPQTILFTFGIPEQPGLSVLQSLQDYLHEKKLLLVLDNCEHLIQACARIVNALLSSSPTLVILATSREALGVHGEMLWHVPSLSLPDIKKLPALERMSQYEAVHLFIERATLVQPHLQVTNENAPAIAQICFRLDGIPLAIELAAARVKTLDVEQIAKRLDDRFRLLTGGSRTVLERHQTLRAAIDWSYNLLPSDEQLLLCRLSVFAGGWTLEAAEQVCAGDHDVSSYDVFDLLSHLVDKSLVILDETRYRLLETTRQYADGKLLEAKEDESVRDRHLIYFLELAGQADKEIHGPSQVEWMHRLERDHDNFRAALDWSVSTGKTEFALRLLGSLSWAWGWGGYFSEMQSWFDKMRGLPDASAHPALYARLLNHLGRQIWLSGDLHRAEALLEESRALWVKLSVEGERGLAETLDLLGWVVRSREGDNKLAQSLFQQGFELYQKHGDQWGMSIAMADWANTVFMEGRHSEAEQLYRKSLAKFQELGDKWGVAYVLGDWGEMARFLGDVERAGRFYEQSLEIRRELGYRRMVEITLFNLAWIRLRTGDYEKARALFEESLELSREENFRFWLVIYLAGFASVLAVTGRLEKAARLFGAFEALLESTGRIMDPADQKEFDDYVAVVRQRLDQAAFEQAWAQGRAMTSEEAIEFALKETDV
jgi:predicted ATPase/class 3 adenylate cyclase